MSPGFRPSTPTVAPRVMIHTWIRTPLTAVNQYELFEIVDTKNSDPDHFISEISEVLRPFGYSHEPIQMDSSDPCHHITIHIFKQVFCSR
jgi:hypothetical protein